MKLSVAHKTRPDPDFSFWMEVVVYKVAAIQCQNNKKHSMASTLVIILAIYTPLPRVEVHCLWCVCTFAPVNYKPGYLWWALGPLRSGFYWPQVSVMVIGGHWASTKATVIYCPLTAQNILPQCHLTLHKDSDVVLYIDVVLHFHIFRLTQKVDRIRPSQQLWRHINSLALNYRLLMFCMLCFILPSYNYVVSRSPTECVTGLWGPYLPWC